MNSRIFLVAHFFPPFAGVGAVRHGYFAKFFTRRGWDVVVFKADNRFYVNKTSEKYIEGSGKIVTIDIASNTPTPSEWNMAYALAIEEEVKTGGMPAVAIFSAAPYFYLKVGLILKQKIGLKYIIDFRDTPFNSLKLYEKYTSFSFRRTLLKASLYLFDPNKEPILNADGILTITESEKKILLRHYKALREEDIQVVCNGYDETFFLQDQDFARENVQTEAEVLEVGVFGKLAYYDTNAASILLSVLSTINETKPVRLNLIGEVESFFTINKASYNFPITQTGFINYEDGIKILRKCQICVLNHRSANSHGTKIFDYIGLNRPIVAFSFPDGEIADLIARFDQAYLVRTTEECLTAFEVIMDKGTYFLQAGDISAEFSRQHQSEKLLSYLRKYSA